jgi:hypothetical protein
MKVYKILHKPTGLYFTPSRGSGNLSSTGKLYPRMPQLKWAGNGVKVIIKTWGDDPKLTKKQKALVNHFNILPNEKSGKGYWIDKCFDVPITDWEIVEI